MPIALHTVAETASFLRDAKNAGLSSTARDVVVMAVAADPGAGDEIVGSGGIRKVRVAGRGKGKSGGYRIMVFHAGPNAPAYILALLSKGDRETFSADEVKAMRSMTDAIRRHWKARPRRSVGPA